MQLIQTKYIVYGASIMNPNATPRRALGRREFRREHYNEISGLRLEASPSEWG
jgi:hypothetical protein